MRHAWMPLVVFHLAAGCADEGTEPEGNTPPGITITSPAVGETFVDGETVSVSVQVTDPDETDLSRLGLSWSGSAIAGGTPQRADAGGVATLSVTPAAGDHDVTVGVTDPDGASASATVLFTVAPDADGDGYGPPEDCDDTDPAIHPGATELCNGIDDDCANGPDDSITFVDWYTDADGDGYGDAATEVSSCEDLSATHVEDGTDCDDLADTTFPGAPELCNDVDDDCANGPDDGLVFVSWYDDADGDGYGDAATEVSSCADLSGTHVPDGTDCDDGSASLNHDDVDQDGFDTCGGDCNDLSSTVEPGAVELCNGFDDNCADGVDEGFPTTDWFEDADQDGYGNPAASVASCLDLFATHSLDATDCDDSSATLNHDDADLDGVDSCAGDCDDFDATVVPGAAEVCNGVDDNCVDGTDENTDMVDWYTDADLDGYGDPASLEQSCIDLSATHVLDGTDCDDNDATLNHDDADRDGFTTCLGDCDDANADLNPEGNEICNGGIDDDCNPKTVETAMVGTVGYPELADAVADVADGGTVELCDGDVFVSGVIINKKVTITSASSDRSATTVDGSGAGADAMFIVKSSGELHLESLTIANATAGAVKAAVSVNPVVTFVDDCLFRDNVAGGNGGAIEGKSIVITNSDFVGNVALQGGAVFAHAAGVLLVTDSTFDGNLATLDGGAFYSLAPVDLTGVEVLGNTAIGNGGGGVVAVSNGVGFFTDTVFSANVAANGGALWVLGASIDAGDTTTFQGNTADNPGTSFGGGVWVQANGNAITWTGGSFFDNVSIAGVFAVGGGMVLDASDLGVAMGSIVASEITLDGNETIGPAAANTGGGIWTQGAPISLLDTVTTNNISDYGAGTSFNSAGGGVVTVERVEYRGNIGVHAGATDIYDAIVTMTDCIIEENVGDVFMGTQYGALLVDFNGELDVTTSDLGVGAADNVPFDVLVNVMPFNTYSYGNGVTFTCDVATADCV